MDESLNESGYDDEDRKKGLVALHGLECESDGSSRGKRLDDKGDVIELQFQTPDSNVSNQQINFCVKSILHLKKK